MTKVAGYLNLSKEDASKAITILCVALRQKDKHIKKFVFTNQPSIYQWHVNNPTTVETMKKICSSAHKLGYHVIMAQRAHAEGELLQFLQERPNMYTHIVAMGCDKNHCLICDKMMKSNKVFGPSWGDLSNNPVSNQFSSNWYYPLALRNALASRHVIVPEDNIKKGGVSLSDTNWFNNEFYHGDLVDIQKGIKKAIEKKQEEINKKDQETWKKVVKKKKKSKKKL